MKRLVLIIVTLLMFQCGWAEDMVGAWGLPSKNIGGINYLLYEEKGGVVVDNYNSWDGRLELPSMVNWEGKDYPLIFLSSIAFEGCKTLTSILIPETVQDIITSYSDYLCERYVIKSPFIGCTQLESIEVAENNRWLSAADGVLYNYDKTKLYNYPCGAKRTHYTIPEGVQFIGTSAFKKCVNLASVSIPNTVTQIFNSCFSGCSNLEEIILPDNISIIYSGCFSGCSKLESIHLPENLTEIEINAFARCTSLRKIVFPEKLKTIGLGAFKDCQLETLVIKGNLDDYSITKLLRDLDGSTTIYVLESEVERYRKLYSGTVLPLDATGIDAVADLPSKTRETFDLQGRRIGKAQEGINIIRNTDGTTKKVLTR